MYIMVSIFEQFFQNSSFPHTKKISAFFSFCFPTRRKIMTIIISSLFFEKYEERTIFFFLVSISRMCCSSTRKKRGKIEQVLLRILINNKTTRKSAGHHGGVAQMVERSLSMREARGSIPRTSSFLSLSPVLIVSIFTHYFNASSTCVVMLCELT